MLDMAGSSDSLEIKRWLSLQLTGDPVGVLMEAAETERLAEMQRLFRTFEDRDRLGHGGVIWGESTPLILASQNGHLEVVNWLLDEHHYLVGCQDRGGHTALWWAAWYGHIGIVSALLDAGEGPTLGDTTGTTPLMVANQRGWSKVVEIFGEYIGIEEANVIIHLSESVEATRAYCDTNEEDNIIIWRRTSRDVPYIVTDWLDQEEALFVAATYGRVTTASLLLQMETNVDCRNNSGETPLMISAKNGDVLMIELLLGFGEARLASINDLGQTALFQQRPVANMKLSPASSGMMQPL